jgi:hypothetical protein
MLKRVATEMPVKTNYVQMTEDIRSLRRIFPCFQRQFELN